MTLGLRLRPKQHSWERFIVAYVEQADVWNAFKVSQYAFLLRSNVFCRNNC